jgi:hypothetical protein
MASAEINKSFLSYAGAWPRTRLVDDQSSADLELDEVFRDLDRSVTTPGQSLLYALLRTTPTDEAEYRRRIDRARYYRDRPELCAALRKALTGVGRQQAGEAVLELFAFPDLGLARYRPWMAGWICATLASFAAPALLGAWAFLLLVIPIALLSLLFYCRTTGRISAHAPSLHYIGRLAIFCGKVGKMRGGGDSEEFARLSAIYPKIRKVIAPAAFLKPVSSMGGDIGDMALMYIKVFMLGELNSYLQAVAAIRDAGEELRSLYEMVGSIDAFCSLAEVAKAPGAPVSANVTCGSRRVAAVAARHPLVQGCVPVSFAFERGVVLTGTNSQDRIAASTAILRGASGSGSIVVAATHDLEIAAALRGEYDPYYFSERIEEGRLVFDYALHEGIADRKNAVKLLRLIGFGEDLLGGTSA